MRWPFRGRASEPTVTERHEPTSWRFVPEPDITAYEIALILSAITPGTGAYSLFRVIDLPHGMRIDARVARHFRPVPHYANATQGA
ncbi:hypothetical protein ACLBYG_22035 [Methylobacterium sp. D53M]